VTRRGAATRGVNAVARGDLYARLGSARGLRVQTVYLAVCSAFLLLSLPPELGRLDVRDANLLLAFLAVQVVAVTYLCSATACAEIALEGEKGLPDLALSAFPTGTIVSGKVVSSALYAVYLALIATPLFVLAAALRGAPIAPIGLSAALVIPLGTAAGVWGAWLGGRLASDFTRSLAHWVLLGTAFGATALLPAGWWPLNPIRLIDRLVREGPTPWLAVAALGWTAVAAAGAWLCARYIGYARAQEADA
jgi:hypothetical protein